MDDAMPNHAEGSRIKMTGYFKRVHHLSNRIAMICNVGPGLANLLDQALGDP
jgi:hypothetical protein